MKLYTDSSSLTGLQSGKTFVALLDNPAQDEQTNVNKIQGFLFLNLEVYEDGYSLLIIESPSTKKKLIALDPLPSGTGIFWTFEAKNKDKLDELVAVINNQYKRPRFISGMGSLMDLLVLLLETSSRDIQTFAQRSADLNSELCVLRHEHELTRKVLYDARDILWSIRINPPSQTSVTKVGREYIDFNALKKNGAVNLTQRLLVPSRGLAGIDIYVVDNCNSIGILTFELVVVATFEVLVVWEVAYSEVKTGWLHLPLSINLGQSHQGVALRIGFNSLNEKSPKLGLTDEKIINAPFIVINNKVQPDKMLAVRTWAGFPGIRNESISSIFGNKVDTKFFEYLLPLSIISQLKLSTERNPGFDCLVIDSNGVVLLHPLFDIEMSAYVPKAIPRGFRKIEAQVMVNGDCSSKAEFAIAAVKHGVDVSQINPYSEECVGSSGWMQISKNYSKELLSLSLVEPYLKEELDLYLFTRVPDSQSVDYCQAQFWSIKVTVDINKAKTVMESETVTLPPVSVSTGIESRHIAYSEYPLNFKNAYHLHEFDIGFVTFYLCSESKLMLHSVINSTNIAVITEVIPYEITHISVDIHTGENCNSNIEFGILLAGTEYQFELKDIIELNENDKLYLHKKVLASSNNQDILSLDITEERNQMCNIYLFVRLLDGEQMDFTDCYFENIRYSIQTV